MCDPGVVRPASRATGGWGAVHRGDARRDDGVAWRNRAPIRLELAIDPVVVSGGEQMAVRLVRVAPRYWESVTPSERRGSPWSLSTTVQSEANVTLENEATWLSFG